MDCSHTFLNRSNTVVELIQSVLQLHTFFKVLIQNNISNRHALKTVQNFYSELPANSKIVGVRLPLVDTDVFFTKTASC